MSYVIWRDSLSIKLQPKKITTGKRYSRLAVGWNKSQITICCLKRQTPTITGKNYDRKKRYSCLAVGWNTCQNMNTNYDQKNYDQKIRYSCLAYTICNSRNILLCHDLVAPLLYPSRERGQSRWRVGWHGSSCWLLCLCVLCFVFCAPTNDQTTVPFFSGRIFFQLCINWCSNFDTRDNYLRFI
jgi:hypothetical protein